MSHDLWAAIIYKSWKEDYCKIERNENNGGCAFYQKALGSVKLTSVQRQAQEMKLFSFVC